MKMPFNVDKAIDNSIEIMKNLEDFYRVYTGEQLAYIKVEDSFFITVDDGRMRLEYNNEGHNSRPYNPHEDNPNYNPTGDHTFRTFVCNVKRCHKTEDEVREQIRLFLYNIPIVGL